jgi:hypothetical protein
VLVGDDYYAAKQRLFTAEQHALRHARFEVHVDHPYRHALHMAAALLPPREGEAPGGGGGGPAAGGGGGGGERARRASDGGRGGGGERARRASDGGGGNGGQEEGPVGPARAAGDAGAVARAAVALLHDALTATRVGAGAARPPEVLAAASLVAALHLLEGEGGGGGGGGEGGAGARAAALVEAAGLHAREVGALALALLRLARGLRERLAAAGPPPSPPPPLASGGPGG